MKGTRASFQPLQGLHAEVPAPSGSAHKLENFTVDPATQGWDNRVGWEKYFVGTTNLYEPFQALGRVDSLYVWTKHAGSLEYILFEADGKLYFLLDWASPVAIRVLSTNRNVPSPAEVGSTYTPFGKWLVILNGHQAPIRYSGWDHTFTASALPIYPLGWTTPPPPPVVWDVAVDPSHPTAETGQVMSVWADGTAEDTNNEHGLGVSTADEVNTYRWKVSYWSNAGGESPVSGPSNEVSWQTPSSGTWALRKFIVGMSIPVGPSGTVARTVYRTKNLGNGNLDTGEPETYYFVTVLKNNTETFFYDWFNDNSLGSESPGAADSIVFPGSQARFSAVFKGCLFVDGGSANGTQLFWSLPGKPDQYTALDFADVGTRAGGEITGFHSNQNYLLVFREQAIDILYGNYPAFEVQPLLQGVGCKASQTARTVPEMGGVLFLANDGVYLVAGSVDGGGTISATKISNPVNREIQRMNLDVAARACAEYSPAWSEYHVYFAADGEDRPSLGLVYHVDKKGWSTRTGYPVGCISLNGNGDLIFGHHTGYFNISRVPAGLFVISHRHVNGMTVVTTGGPGGDTFTTVYNTTPTASIYRSAWHDMGSPAEKKQVIYVYLYAYTMGDDPVTVTAMKDYNSTGVDCPVIRLQRADWSDQLVYGLAQVGTAVWEENAVACYRVAVNAGFEKVRTASAQPGQGGNTCSWWAFEIETTADMVLFGYGIEMADGTQQIVQAKGAL